MNIEDKVRLRKRDIEIIVTVVVRVIGVVETAKQSGPSFDLDRAIERVVEDTYQQFGIEI
jgi:hypothetical protein